MSAPGPTGDGGDSGRTSPRATPAQRTALALEVAREAGFDLVGVTPLRPPRAAERFEAWLEAGFHADMEWLERQRERIVDPRRILPEGTSLLVVGLGHHRPAVELEGGGRVARYAGGRDYHNVIGKQLRKLARRLEELGLGGRSRSIVDAGPLLERSHAAEAGLGFESKAANLLHPDHGPWFFLGELLLEAELEPTPAPSLGSCGTCRACIDACPTDAIVDPGRVDANRCISYHTIENRGQIPHELRASFGTWAFGCDICSEVCPWGTDASDEGKRFGTHAAIAEQGLVDWLRQPPGTFTETWRGSPLQRPKRDGLARNAALALGNAPSEEGRDALLSSLEEEQAPLVREAAAWALVQAHFEDAGVSAAVERARSIERDGEAASGMTRSLDGA